MTDRTTDPADQIDAEAFRQRLDSEDSLQATLDALAASGGKSFDKLGQTFREYERVRIQAGRVNGQPALWNPIKAGRDRRRGKTTLPGIWLRSECRTLDDLEGFDLLFARAWRENDRQEQFSIINMGLSV